MCAHFFIASSGGHTIHSAYNICCRLKGWPKNSMNFFTSIAILKAILSPCPFFFIVFEDVEIRIWIRGSNQLLTHKNLSFFCGIMVERKCARTHTHTAIGWAIWSFSSASIRRYSKTESTAKTIN